MKDLLAPLFSSRERAGGLRVFSLRKAKGRRLRVGCFAPFLSSSLVAFLCGAAGIAVIFTRGSAFQRDDCERIAVQLMIRQSLAISEVPPNKRFLAGFHAKDSLFPKCTR